MKIRGKVRICTVPDMSLTTEQSVLYARDAKVDLPTFAFVAYDDDNIQQVSASMTGDDPDTTKTIYSKCLGLWPERAFQLSFKSQKNS